MCVVITAVFLASSASTPAGAPAAAITPTPSVQPPDANRRSQEAICRTTDDLLASAESAPDEGWDVPSKLAKQLPAEFGAGLIHPFEHPIPQATDLAEGRPDAAEWVNELEGNGFEDGLERWWAGTGTVAGAEVLRFGSHEGALGFQHWIIHGSCVNASRVFAVQDMPGSIGLRLLWEGGDISEQVSFVRGPYRYLVSIRSREVPLRWWIVDETARLGIALGIPMSLAPTPCSDNRGRLASVDRLSPANDVLDNVVCPLATQTFAPDVIAGLSPPRKPSADITGKSYDARHGREGNARAHA